MSRLWPPQAQALLLGALDVALSQWPLPWASGRKPGTHTKSIFPEHLRLYKCQLFQNILRFTKKSVCVCGGGGVWGRITHQTDADSLNS